MRREECARTAGCSFDGNEGCTSNRIEPITLPFEIKYNRKKAVVAKEEKDDDADCGSEGDMCDDMVREGSLMRLFVVVVVWRPVVMATRPNPHNIGFS